MEPNGATDGPGARKLTRKRPQKTGDQEAIKPDENKLKNGQDNSFKIEEDAGPDAASEQTGKQADPLESSRKDKDKQKADNEAEIKEKEESQYDDVKRLIKFTKIVVLQRWAYVPSCQKRIHSS